MKLKGILMVTALLICGVASAQTDSYKQKVKTYFELSGSQGAFQEAIKGMIGQMRVTRTDVPQSVWDEFENEFMSTSIDELVGLIAPIYNRHFTEEDLDAIIEFYNTPAGKKLGEKTPIITQESMTAGQQWGMQVGQKIVNKLQEKGY